MLTRGVQDGCPLQDLQEAARLLRLPRRRAAEPLRSSSHKMWPGEVGRATTGSSCHLRAVCPYGEWHRAYNSTVDRLRNVLASATRQRFSWSGVRWTISISSEGSHLKWHPLETLCGPLSAAISDVSSEHIAHFKWRVRRAWSRGDPSCRVFRFQSG